MSDVGCGMWIADCGLRIADYGLRIAPKGHVRLGDTEINVPLCEVEG